MPKSQSHIPGVAVLRREVYDQYGNRTWILDERGFIFYNAFDIRTGGLVLHIDDVDTSQVSDAPVGWTTPTGGST